MPNSFSHEERFEYLKQFGSHCMAYSTLQPGMEYFDLPGVGYLAYMEHGRTRFVLAEPICAEGDRPRVIAEALREHEDTCFVQVQQPTARLLHDEFGFYATPMGVEIDLDVQTYSIAGVRKQKIRQASNKVRRAGVRIQEINEIAGSMERLKAISDAWRHTKANRQELCFLTRPPTWRQEPHERYFVALGPDGEIVGYVFFDPIFRGGGGDGRLCV